MVNKHMKRCLLVIRKNENQNHSSNYNFKKWSVAMVCKGMEKLEPSYIIGEKVK